ncbi:hypothetical protein NEMIN01_1220 [Nematocida minor]|uniref:uncharacterized protein n=1 Tax=Nematocida minor TaxID=1912983 RepID=UPI00221E68EF|nr:uncharacterized protein NEMIN01_1220 [Nematocida minor]KAI5190818.1 hypothetical protein NEMIN01_1220 [Nematocida minor]
MWFRFLLLVKLALCYYIDEKYRNSAVDVDFSEDSNLNVYISFSLGGFVYSSVIHMEKIQRFGRSSFTTYNAVYTKKSAREEQSKALCIHDALQEVQGWFLRENATGILSGVLVDDEKIIHIKPKQFLFPSSSKKDLVAFVADEEFPEYVCKPLEDTAENLEFDEPLEDDRDYFDKAAEYFRKRPKHDDDEEKGGFLNRLKRLVPSSIRPFVFWWEPVKTHPEAREGESGAYDSFTAPETREEKKARERKMAVKKEIEKLREQTKKSKCKQCNAKSMYRKSLSEGSMFAAEGSVDKTKTSDEKKEKKDEMDRIFEKAAEEHIHLEKKSSKEILESLENGSTEHSDDDSNESDFYSNESAYSDDAMAKNIDANDESEVAVNPNDFFLDVSVNSNVLSRENDASAVSIECTDPSLAILRLEDKNSLKKSPDVLAVLGPCSSTKTLDLTEVEIGKIDAARVDIVQIDPKISLIDKTKDSNEKTEETFLSDSGIQMSEHAEEEVFARVIDEKSVFINPGIDAKDASDLSYKKIAFSKLQDTPSLPSYEKTKKKTSYTPTERQTLSRTERIKKKRAVRNRSKARNRIKNKKENRRKGRKKIPHQKVSETPRLIKDIKDRVVGNTFVTTQIPKANKSLKKGEVVLLGIPYYSQIAKVESSIGAMSNYGFPIEKRAIPVAIALDYHFIEKVGSKREAIFSALENMNIASRIYEKSFNVLLYVSDIIIDSNAEWFHSVGTLTQKLSQFEQYRAKKRKKCMVYHLFTSSEKPCKQIGLAWRGSIGYNNRRNISTSVFTQNQFITVAHEIGHNLGLPHDCDDKACETADPLNYVCNPCKGCSCKGKYIMNSRKESHLLAFSPPAQRLMSVVLSHLEIDLPKVDEISMPYPMCGNGIVEKGEECDAGPFGDACCTPDCKLRLGAVCSDFNSGCCKKCHPAPAGTVCRKSQNECQHDSVCNGMSVRCPAASFFANSQKCSNGFCANGMCTNKDTQCVMAGDMRSLVAAVPGYKGCTMKCLNVQGKHVTISDRFFRNGTPCGWNGTCLQGRCTKDLGLAALTVLALLIGLLLVGLALI